MNSTQLSELERELINRERDLSTLSADEQFKLIKQRAKGFVDAERLRTQLRYAKENNAPLRIKYGIDPTHREAHLGHIVPVILARRFLQMGHQVVLVLGDFTAFIGDPMGRLSTRPILAREQIHQNTEVYTQQLAKFIDVSKIKIVFNSDFYDPKVMSVSNFIEMLRKNPVSQLTQLEAYRERKDAGFTIAEFIYPTLMAIDSIKLQTQVELGGNDQLLNFHIAKTFMEHEGIEPETAVTTELLESTAGDGKKMSKSEGNYVSLLAPANEVYGKIMSIPDRLMEQYFKLLTDITDDQWQELAEAMRTQTIHPKDVKQLLARVIVTWMHNSTTAQTAEQHFIRVFSHRDVPDDILTVHLTYREGLTWLDIADEGKIVTSRSTFRRLVSEKSVKLMSDENRIVADPLELVPIGTHVLRYGRGKFVRIIVE